MGDVTSKAGFSYDPEAVGDLTSYAQLAIGLGVTVNIGAIESAYYSYPQGNAMRGSPLAVGIISKAITGEFDAIE